MTLIIYSLLKYDILDFVSDDTENGTHIVLGDNYE
jgi:hypothetical protein